MGFAPGNIARIFSVWPSISPELRSAFIRSTEPFAVLILPGATANGIRAVRILWRPAIKSLPKDSLFQDGDRVNDKAVVGHHEDERKQEDDVGKPFQPVHPLCTSGPQGP